MIKLSSATALFTQKSLFDVFWILMLQKWLYFNFRKLLFKKGWLQRNGDIGWLQKWKHGRQETWHFCHHCLHDGSHPSVTLGLSFLACWITVTEKALGDVLTRQALAEGLLCAGTGNLIVSYRPACRHLWIQQELHNHLAAPELSGGRGGMDSFQL